MTVQYDSSMPSYGKSAFPAGTHFMPTTVPFQYGGVELQLPPAWLSGIAGAMLNMRMHGLVQEGWGLPENREWTPNEENWTRWTPPGGYELAPSGGYSMISSNFGIPNRNAIRQIQGGETTAPSTQQTTAQQPASPYDTSSLFDQSTYQSSFLSNLANAMKSITNQNVQPFNPSTISQSPSYMSSFAGPQYSASQALQGSSQPYGGSSMYSTPYYEFLKNRLY